MVSDSCRYSFIYESMLYVSEIAEKIFFSKVSKLEVFLHNIVLNLRRFKFREENLQTIFSMNDLAKKNRKKSGVIDSRCVRSRCNVIELHTCTHTHRYTEARAHISIYVKVAHRGHTLRNAPIYTYICISVPMIRA